LQYVIVFNIFLVGKNWFSSFMLNLSLK